MQPREGMESDASHDAEVMSSFEQRIRSLEGVSKSKGLAHFRKNEVRFPGGVKFRNGEEIRFNGRAFTLRPKPRDYKTYLLYGALAAVLVLLVASQMVRQSDSISEPSLVGVVIDQQTGAVMPDVKVTLQELGKSVMTNQDGMFIFEILPEGDYTITGETPFFKTASLSFQHGKHGETLVGLPMEKSARLAKEEPTKETNESVPEETKKFGSIEILTDVDNAQVYLDKRSYGKGSRTIDRVYVGKHRLVLKADGYETVSTTIDVDRDKTTSVEVSMEKLEDDAPPELTAADYVRIGDSAAALGSLAEAIESYTIALEMEERAETYYRRAQIYHQTGKLEQARRDFSRAGGQFAASAQITSAIGAYNAILDLFPNDFRTLRARGYAYIQKGDYELALSDFETACELDGDDYQNRVGLGHAYSMIGKYKDAIGEYRKAEDLTDDKAEVYALIALASLARGKEKDAKKYYEKFLETATPDVERRYASDPEWQRLKQLASSD
jgi:Flp pilus assembly protein TadD